jgi:hypothetical protein
MHSRQFSSVTFTCTLICALALPGCNGENVADASVLAPKSAHRTENPPPTPDTSISAAAAEMFTGVIAALRAQPRANAVDLYAQVFQWQRADVNVGSLSMAGHGFAGTLAGEPVLLQGNGTNELFSIVIPQHFEPPAFLAYVRSSLDATPLASGARDERCSEVYRLFDGPTEIGVLMIALDKEGATPQAARISYFASDRAYQLAGSPGELLRISTGE